MFEKHVGSVRQWQLFIWIISCTSTSISIWLTKGKRLATSGNPHPTVPAAHFLSYKLSILGVLLSGPSSHQSINVSLLLIYLSIYLCTCSPTFLALTAPLSLLYSIPPIYSLLMIYKPSSCCSFSLSLAITAVDYRPSSSSCSSSLPLSIAAVHLLTLTFLLNLSPTMNISPYPPFALLTFICC